MDSRTDGSAQEVGMQKLRYMRTLASGLFAITLAGSSAIAQDYGGTYKVPSIDWKTSYKEATEESIRDGKPILVRVTAVWCGPCRQMKQLTFADSRVVDIVQAGFVPLMIDADENPEMVTKFHVEAFPTTIVIAPDQTELKRMAGFQSANDLFSALLPLSKSQPAVRKRSGTDDAVSALDPENALKFGFDGYCLVSLLEETRVRRGLPEFVAEHRGQTICFQSEEHLQKFQADPEKYWPVANGQCLVRSREEGSTGRGDPRMAVTWRGRIWMFSDRQRQRRFIQSPLYYVNGL